MQSMSSEEFVGGLTYLRLPGSMVETIALSLRYFYLLREESQRMLRARQARSAGRRGPWLWRLRTHGSFLGNLLLRSLSRSERVFLAMQARGYRRSLPMRSPGKLGRLDLGLSWTCALAMVAAITFRVAHPL
jgi:cobalt/nickel transport system permease protein